MHNRSAVVLGTYSMIGWHGAATPPPCRSAPAPESALVFATFGVTSLSCKRSTLPTICDASLGLSRQPERCNRVGTNNSKPAYRAGGRADARVPKRCDWPLFCCKDAGSHLTLRWRKADSNHRSRSEKSGRSETRTSASCIAQPTRAARK
jgi:hypothetical protein